MLIERIGDLRVYSTAVLLAKEIDSLVAKIPFSWKNKDADQIKRSSSSVASNIAEGFSRRFYKKDFIRFLAIALSSSDETQSHLILLYEKGLITLSTRDRYLKQYKNLSIKILNLINYLRRKG